MLIFSVGGTDTKRNLKADEQVELVPGIEPILGTISKESLGITLLKYELSAECEECKEGKKYSLKQYSVKVYSEIRLRASYDAQDLEKFAAYSEGQHAQDYTDWANTPVVKDTMEKIESKVSKKKFGTKKECEDKSKILFLKDDLLKRKAKDANVATRKKYDDGDARGNPPLHRYPGEGKWGPDANR
jgi:hypothetical protein